MLIWIYSPSQASLIFGFVIKDLASSSCVIFYN